MNESASHSSYEGCGLKYQNHLHATIITQVTPRMRGVD